MIQFEHTEVSGWEAAIRGMRNPLNSWERSDSGHFFEVAPEEEQMMRAFDELMEYVVGPNDRELMLKLAKAGSEHAKYRRMVNVTVDITAPLYWWKEFDTYKVGTVANSCSTMHKLHKNKLTLDDFSCEHMGAHSVEMLKGFIRRINASMDCYNDSGDKKFWYQAIQLLPSSYNQRRTVQLNYEVLAAMYRQRKAHKLDEWRELCEWVEALPYSEIITAGCDD